jgi:hypothetical protein
VSCQYSSVEFVADPLLERRLLHRRQRGDRIERDALARAQTCEHLDRAVGRLLAEAQLPEPDLARGRDDVPPATSLR